MSFYKTSFLLAFFLSGSLYAASNMPSCWDDLTEISTRLAASHSGQSTPLDPEAHAEESALSPQAHPVTDPTQARSTDYFQFLPAELILKIFQKIPCQDFPFILNVGLTCKLFYRISMCPSRMLSLNLRKSETGCYIHKDSILAQQTHLHRFTSNQNMNQEVIDLLINQKSLRMLYLNKCPKVGKLWALDPHFFSRQPQLTHLSLIDCGLQAPELLTTLAGDPKSLPNLTHLNLSGNFIGDKGVIALAKALQHLTKLTCLNLELNDTGDEGAHALAKAISAHCPNLTDLDLGYNQITDEGTRALAQALFAGRPPKFAKLSLSDNHIRDEGARALAQALQYHTKLTRLYLNENRMGDEGALALQALQKANPTLNLVI
ncbi:MAG: hypothetical protein ACK5PQ_05085 [Alphaproteobacteria bacterium]